jgi:hypothetical protein
MGIPWGQVLPIVGPMFDAGANFQSTVWGNQFALDRAREGSGMVDSFNADVDAERDIWSGQDLYGGRFDPSRFGADQFTSDTDFAGLLQGMRDQYGAARGDALGLLGAQQRDPMQTARAAGSFISDVSTDKFLREQLAGIGANSKARLGQASQDTIAATLAGGGSLANTRDRLNALRYSEGVNRDTAVRGAEATAEAARNQNMQLRGQLQNAAMLGQINTNAGLAQTGAGLASELGAASARAMYDVGQFQNFAQDRDQTQAFDAYSNMLTTEAARSQDAFQRAMGLLGMKQQNILSQAGMISGVPFTIPQTTVGRDIAQNLLQQQAIGASRQSAKASANMTIAGFGGGGGCIGSHSLVITRHRGPAEIAGIVPGDEVMGADGEYHAVVAKDCGQVPEGQRHDMLLIGVQGAWIEATPDHVLGGVTDGKPAGQWRPGDRITVDGAKHKVERVLLTPWQPSADIMLAGDVPYLANGFVVHSNIGREGLNAWRERVAREGAELDGYIVSIENPNGVWAQAAEVAA